MRTRPFVGVWLDHREAFLFWADEQANVVAEHLKSDYQEVGEPVERATSGGVGTVGPALPHASVERRHKEQLKHYYRELAEALRDAQHIYLFGHGLAKNEFVHFLQDHRQLGERVEAVEGVNRMTEPQMIARVKEFFRLPRAQE